MSIADVCQQCGHNLYQDICVEDFCKCECAIEYE